MLARETVVCPCGAPAPAYLPPRGRRPVRCERCDTPLVAADGLPPDAYERGAGSALFTATLCAVAWMVVARATGSGATALVPAAALAIGLSAWWGARTRGPVVQLAAGSAFAAFLVFGEVLLYRGALLPRLVALHRAERADDPLDMARRELREMDVAHYSHIELTFGFFVAVALGFAAVLLVTRAPRAVVAFVRREPPPLLPAEDVVAAPPSDTSEEPTPCP